MAFPRSLCGHLPSPAQPSPARRDGAESIYCGGAGGAGGGKCIIGRLQRLDRQSPLLFASGAFKSGGRSCARLLEGFRRRIARLQKAGRGEMIDGRRRQISGGDKIITAAAGRGRWYLSPPRGSNLRESSQLHAALAGGAAL